MRSVQGWTAVLLQPGVMPILAVLHEHQGLRTFAEIRAAAPARDAVVAANVLRMLGARDFAVRGGAAAGTWDQPSDASLFALTDRGREFAAAVATLTDFASRLPRRRRHSTVWRP
jgi:hypothetical protein